jgi:hypothetical protein
MLLDSICRNLPYLVECLKTEHTHDYFSAFGVARNRGVPFTRQLALVNLSVKETFLAASIKF